MSRTLGSWMPQFEKTKNLGPMKRSGVTIHYRDAAGQLVTLAKSFHPRRKQFRLAH
jgi:hypothetical protein